MTTLRKIFMAPEEVPASGTPAADPSQVTPPAAPPAAPAPAADPATPATPPKQETLLTKEPAVPEEIKLKFPDGATVDEALLGKFVPLAKDLGLKSEGAQKLADLFVEAQKAVETRHMETITQWAEEAKADKEIGGAAFDANLAIAQKAMSRFLTPGLKEVLGKTGLGNHKDVIKLFVNIGKSISEDRLPGSGATQEAGPSRDDLMREAFPNSPQMFPQK